MAAALNVLVLICMLRFSSGAANWNCSFSEDACQWKVENFQVSRNFLVHKSNAKTGVMVSSEIDSQKLPVVCLVIDVARTSVFSEMYVIQQNIKGDAFIMNKTISAKNPAPEGRQELQLNLNYRTKVVIKVNGFLAIRKTALFHSSCDKVSDSSLNCVPGDCHWSKSNAGSDTEHLPLHSGVKNVTYESPSTNHPSIWKCLVVNVSSPSVYPKSIIEFQLKTFEKNSIIFSNQIEDQVNLEIDLNANSRFKIVMIVNGTLLIHNIAVTKNQCPQNLMQCTFENKCELNYKMDPLKFKTYIQGKQLEVGIDHNPGTLQGYAIALQSSDKLESGYLLFSTESCFSYWFYMNEQSTSVKVSFAIGYNQKILKVHNGSTDSMWRAGQFNVPHKRYSLQIFSYMSSTKSKGIVAFDDIKITRGKCSSKRADCNFEHANCTWSARNFVGRWIVVRADKNDYIGGIPKDHTLNYHSGHYLYLAPNRVPKAGASHENVLDHVQAEFLSIEIEKSESLDFMKMWIASADDAGTGNDHNNISVYQVKSGKDKQSKCIFTSTGNYKKWTLGQFTIPPSKENYYIKIVGYVSAKSQHGLAIDDISFHYRSASKTTHKTSPTATTKTSAVTSTSSSSTNIGSTFTATTSVPGKSRQKSKGLSGGEISAILIVTALIIASVVAAFIYLRKRRISKYFPKASTATTDMPTVSKRDIH